MKCLKTVALLVLLAFSVPRLSANSPGEKSPEKRGTSQRVFTGVSLREIAFPIGGIGTGSISLGGRGDLRDWEIFGRPDKGSHLSFSFFALWVHAPGKDPVTKVLERKFMPPYAGGGFGIPQRELSGLPRLDEAEFTGEYPFASIRFRDDSLPVSIELEAWNPFIPLDVDNSALPVVILDWLITNPTPDTIDIALAASLFNPIGSRYTNVKGEIPGLGGNVNEFRDENELQGLVLYSKSVKEDNVNFGSMALATPWKQLNVQTRWYRGGWWDQCHLFWDDFSDDGTIAEIRDTLSSDKNRSDVGSLVLHARIPPRGSVKLPILLTWYFPNLENYWNGNPEVRGKVMKKYVSGRFTDAWDVAGKVAARRSRLERETRLFHDVLFNSTLPTVVLDAVSSQMSTLKTNVCILLEDGSFYGFEGLGDKAGCCPLNCTHVWNYEQTLAYLFPRLERSMRETDFLHNTFPNGYMVFRTLVPKDTTWWKFKACADGQMGAIIRVYREWKLSGDTDWLKSIWPKVKLALEFAWKGPGNPPPEGFEWTKEQIAMPWDPDTNGVMEGEQHNTYDIEFYGPNTMTGTNYLGALKAAAEMAQTLGERESASMYQELYEQGSRQYDELLWNGDYYDQDVYVLKGLQVPSRLISPDTEDCEEGCSCSTSPGGTEPALDTIATVNPKYQYGKGCLSDQLLGQYLAHGAGLGYLMTPEHVKKAVKSIYDFNFRSSMSEFSNVQRVYALNDEAGLLLCSWPNGNRPALPFVYSDEVWTGIEYEIAATLIYNGWVKEGLEVVTGVRNRYAGYNRNPWDEVECGHHYARAMASWALLVALSGYSYDGVDHTMGFVPRMTANEFRSFWSCGSGWGTFRQEKTGKRQTAHLRVDYGSLSLNELHLDGRGKPGSVRTLLDGNPVGSRVVENQGAWVLRFERTAELSAGSTLEVIIEATPGADD